LAHIQNTARRVAMRLIKARPEFSAKPQTDEELMSMIESMLKTPRRWGVHVLPYEARCVRQYHALMRAKKSIMGEAEPGATT
jgi:hypothetical protein